MEPTIETMDEQEMLAFLATLPLSDYGHACVHEDLDTKGAAYLALGATGVFVSINLTAGEGTQDSYVVTVHTLR